MLTRSALIFCLICGVLDLARPFAGAQGMNQQEREDLAKEHFYIGTGLYNGHRFAEAAEHFDKSYRLSPKSSMLYNLFLAARKADRKQQAAAALKRFLKEGKDIQNRQSLETELADLEQEISQSESAHQPVLQSSSTQAEPSQFIATETDTTPYIIGGVSIALLLTGAVATGIALSQKADADSYCSDGLCQSAYQGAIDRYESNLALGLGFLITSVVGLGIATLLALSSDDEPELSTKQNQQQANCSGVSCLRRLHFNF
ncbi:MAG: hypothetical protein IPJ88_18295 [Myxococcales bacterium]|nr:MAG: hypothetical protein IPJ88_18295 [Myxococcales bacterium]